MTFIKNVASEFKAFALRGSVVDLAVGVVIGAAFNSVVNSLVKDILTPPIGMIVGKADFADWYINLSSKTYETFAEAQAAGAPTINYGLFINSLIGFVVTAWAIFLVVKAINRMHRTAEDPKESVPDSKKCPYCLTRVPLKATRCSSCTSDLESDVDSNKS